MAIVRTDPPEVHLASNAEVMSRLIALRVVARTNPKDVPSEALKRIRSALLKEQWADAVKAWMEVTDDVVDAYPDEEVFTEKQLDEEATSFEIRMARIFEDNPDD